MFRLGAALVVAVFLMQATGLSLAAVVPCTEQCADDGPDGQCAPSCEDCLCCAHPRAAWVAPAGSVVQVAGRLLRATWVDESPPEAEVQDILRVPKPRAA